jgi:multidrug efflux pump subunit AcrA (membrane-fusion protein)
MRAVLPNDNMNIKDGMFVKVNLLADTVKNAIAIPESSIGSDQAGRFVYLVDDSNRVAKRHVEVGILNADNYRQIVKGMNANSRYVQSGIVKVHEGQTVNPITNNNK